MVSLLDIRGLTKRYAGVTALDGVDFSADAGEIHAIVGANGAGKSTLMNLLSGAESASAGEIRIGDQRAALATPAAAQAMGVATVYQEFTLVPQLSVARNIFLGKEPRGRMGLVDNQALLRNTESLLKRLRLDLSPDAEVSTLSVADQQLVEIARALSTDARILILDEPTAVLSLHEQENLFEIMRRLRSEGMLILFVSHRLEEVLEIADRVTALRDGRKISTEPIKGLAIGDIVRMMIGKEAAVERVTSKAPEGPDLYQIDYVTAAGEQSIAMKAGEILGLAGLVGAGRSGFARAMVGKGNPGTHTHVTRQGVSLATANPRQAVRSGLIYLTEDRKKEGIFRGLDIISNTSAAALPAFASAGIRKSRAERAAARDILNDLHLVAARLGLPIENLSGGNQQKVVLARALLAKPQLLLIDEPTRGVDVGAKAEIHRIIAALAGSGMCVIVISSEIEELLGLTHRIVVMKDHRFRDEMNTAHTNKEEILFAASGGDAERKIA